MTQTWHGWTVSYGIIGQQRRFMAYGEKPWSDAEISNAWRRWGVQFFPTRKAARAFAATKAPTKARLHRAVMTIRTVR